MRGIVLAVLLFSVLFVGACSEGQAAKQPPLNPSDQVTEMVDCDSDAECFSQQVIDCSRARARLEYGTVVTANEVLGVQDDACLIEVVYVVHPDPQLEDSFMRCAIPNDELSNFNEFLANSAEEVCEGSFLEVIDNKFG